METTARNRTIGGIVIGAIILILLLVLFSCTVNSDPESSPKKDPTTGESSLPSDPDTIEPDDKPSEKDSDDPEIVDDDIVPAANTGVTFIPAGNVPSGSTPTCELDPSACEDTRPPGAGVDICEIRPDLTQCQEPEPPTTPPGEEEPPTNPEEPEPEEPELPVCGIWPLPDCPEDPENQAPTAPVVNECVVETSTRATISWSKSEDPDGKVAGYNVYRDPDATMSDNGKRTATFSDLTPGETYTFWVRAVDSKGKRSDASNRVECFMDADAPDVPADVTVTSIDPTDSTLEVSWTESEDNPNPGGIGDVTYNIYRNGRLIESLYEDTTFVDSGLEAGKQYTYTVTAVDGLDHESAPSAEAVGETTKNAPTVPQNVKVTDVDIAGFTVSWDASTDLDGVTPQDQIEYIVNVSGGLLCGARSNPGATSMRVICLLGQNSSVTVTAEDTDGNRSAPSAPASAEEPEAEGGNVGLRSTTPGTKADSDVPAKSPVPSDAPSVEAPVEAPTEEKEPLLPGLDDILPGGDDTAEEPAAEEPAEPEATPSESESPAARPTTEEPADEATEDAPAEEDEGGLLGDIVDSVTSAVAAVF
ncbi:cellulose 1,4-beta-cellobiosidase [Nocardioidaceae bacterium Broad-1]|nr:cellulose 1,4-beta-cellobiosidase [Nocardioidaceae bacterium Broad-1]